MGLTCRFIDIDCPEYGQPFHEDALKALESFRIDTVKVYGLDQYNRCLVEAFSGDLNIGEELTRQGLAWTISPKYRAQEREAQRTKRGLWKQKNPVPPWEYRKDHERVKRSL